MKYIYITCGFVCLGLGAAGAVLPVLPTTPFLLLSLCCFARGSARLQNWFLATSLFRKYLVPYFTQKGLTRTQKARILIFSDFWVLFAFLKLKVLPVRILLLLLNLVKYWYFLCIIKTVPPAAHSSEEEHTENAAS